MKKVATKFVFLTIGALWLSLMGTTPASAAEASGTEANPFSLCLRLYPPGPQSKPPVLAVPSAGKKCQKYFKYYELTTIQDQITNLNALLIGSFNSGLAIGVYSTVAKMNEEASKRK